MKPYTLLLRRFIWNSGEKTIQNMMIICFISIMLGTFALALVSAIMNGFEYETHAVIQGIHPDIIISAGDRSLKYEALRKFLEQEYSGSIAGISPSAQEHALVKLGENSTFSAPVLIIGIDPHHEQEISRLDRMLLTSSGQSFDTLFDDSNVIMGSGLAQKLSVTTHATVTLLFNPEGAHETEQVMLEKEPVHIAGIFKTGIDELDAHVIICSLALFNKLFPGSGITQIGLKLTKPSEQTAIIQQLHTRLPELNIYSWQDMYPALLSALLLEKYAMFFILALITLVASMNIVALLFMYINSKKMDIAILQTLGLSARAITSIFTSIGMTIALSATFLGIICATITSILLNRYQLIKLPDVYYVTHLPAHMDMNTLIAVLALVILISFIASYIPARRVLTLNVAHILRQAL